MSETPSSREQYVDLSDSTKASGSARSPDQKDAAVASEMSGSKLRPYWVRLDIKVPLEFK
jgi:hypothetical protein